MTWQLLLGLELAALCVASIWWVRVKGGRNGSR